MKEAQINASNSRGRMNQELRRKFLDKLDDWFGGSDKYKIVFAWLDSDAMSGEAHIVAETKLPCGSDWDTKEVSEWVTQTFFLTLFTIGDRIEISQDKKIESRRK